MNSETDSQKTRNTRQATSELLSCQKQMSQSFLIYKIRKLGWDFNTKSSFASKEKGNEWQSFFCCQVWVLKIPPTTYFHRHFIKVNAYPFELRPV